MPSTCIKLCHFHCSDHELNLNHISRGCHYSTLNIWERIHIETYTLYMLVYTCTCPTERCNFIYKTVTFTSRGRQKEIRGTLQALSRCFGLFRRRDSGTLTQSQTLEYNLQRRPSCIFLRLLLQSINSVTLTLAFNWTNVCLQLARHSAKSETMFILVLR